MKYLYRKINVLARFLILLFASLPAPSFAQLPDAQVTTNAPSPQDVEVTTNTPAPQFAELIPYTSATIGANEKVWEQVMVRTNASVIRGRSVKELSYHTNRVTELATGMNYWDPNSNQWLPSSEAITITATGGKAVNGQTKATFSANINTLGATDLQLSDGQHLKHHIEGLMYLDASSGESVCFAVLKDSIGQVQPSGNVVVYSDSFSGGITADVRYENRRDQFSQEVVIRSQLPDPYLAYGFNPQTTKLQVITEFLDPPTASVRSTGNDIVVDFGSMMFGPGRAFALGDEAHSVPVRKYWLSVQARHFLIEETDYAPVAAQLGGLPAFAPPSGGTNPATPMLNQVSPQMVFPPPLLAKQNTQGLKVASAAGTGPGLVLDYTALTTTVTNYVFRGDTTYYISGNVTASGTNTTF